VRATRHHDSRRKMTGSANFSLEMFGLHMGNKKNWAELAQSALR
jgi:hypothetical protein